MTSPSRSWRVRRTKQANKDLDKHRGNAARIAAALSRLRQGPEIGESLRGTLRDCWSLHFSVPGTQFRAAYVVGEDQDGPVIWVFCIAPRENFYDEVERRYPPNLG